MRRNQKGGQWSALASRVRCFEARDRAPSASAVVLAVDDDARNVLALDAAGVELDVGQVGQDVVAVCHGARQPDAGKEICRRPEETAQPSSPLALIGQNNSAHRYPLFCCFVLNIGWYTNLSTVAYRTAAMIMLHSSIYNVLRFMDQVNGDSADCRAVSRPPLPRSGACRDYSPQASRSAGGGGGSGWELEATAGIEPAYTVLQTVA